MPPGASLVSVLPAPMLRFVMGKLRRAACLALVASSRLLLACRNVSAGAQGGLVELHVTRWKRYGHDRLYANLPDGTAVGWADVTSGTSRSCGPNTVTT